MEFLRNLILSKNVWTVVVAMFVVWTAFSGLGTLLYPIHSGEIIIYTFKVVLTSFLSASILFKIIIKIINYKFSFEDFNLDPLWIFILILGSLIFLFVLQKPTYLQLRFFYGSLFIKFCSGRSL